eukprot:gene22950-23139_t
MHYTPLFGPEVAQLLSVAPSVPGALPTAGDTKGDAAGEVDEGAVAAKQLELLQRQLSRLATEKATAAAAQGAVEAAHSEEISDAAPAAGATATGAGNGGGGDSDSVESSSDESSADELDASDLTRTSASSKALSAAATAAAAVTAAANARDGDGGTAASNAALARNLKQVLVHFQSNNTTASAKLGRKGGGMGQGDVVAEVAALPQQRRWAYFMLRGGHFAGAIFQGDKVTVHKCFH